MSNKVALVFENGVYSISVNDEVVNNEKNLDSAFAKFKEAMKDNLIVHTNSWESIEASAVSFDDDRVEINAEHKTVTFGKMKYFYNTNKLFYMTDGKMIPLLGGYHLFNFILTVVKAGQCDDYESILKFCKDIIECKATYRTNEEVFTVGCAAFNYGAAEYNFSSGKIHKGASITKGSFDEFKGYVLAILKG